MIDPNPPPQVFNPNFLSPDAPPFEPLLEIFRTSSPLPGEKALLDLSPARTHTLLVPSRDSSEASAPKERFYQERIPSSSAAGSESQDSGAPQSESSYRRGQAAERNLRRDAKAEPSSSSGWSNGKQRGSNSLDRIESSGSHTYSIEFGCASEGEEEGDEEDLPELSAADFPFEPLESRSQSAPAAVGRPSSASPLEQRALEVVNAVVKKVGLRSAALTALEKHS